MLNYKSFFLCVHILDNSSLLDVSFANIFSTPVACIPTLWVLSLTEKIPVIFMKFSLFLSWFMPLMFYLQGHCHVQGFLLVTLQECYGSAFYIYVNDLILLHFCGGRTVCVETHPSACGCPVVPEPSVEETVFAALSRPVYCDMW